MDYGHSFIGQEVSGCVIEREQGVGGMAQVYLARRLADDATVVVKFIHPEEAGNTQWRARFVREAEILKRLQHPNIVEIFSFDGDCKNPHIVLEYL